MSSLLERVGRANALAAATAAIVLIAGVVGVFTKDADDAGDSRAEIARRSQLGSQIGMPTLAPIDIIGGAGPGATSGPGAVASAGPNVTGGGALFAGAKRGPAKGTPVKVGVHLNDNEGAAAQFGVAGLPNISDAEVQAVVAQVNKAGGLAGRPIAPVFHRTDPVSGTFDSQGQAACASFADDNRMNIVIDNALSPSKVLANCLSAKRIPLVWELHMSQITNAEMTRWRPYVYRPSMPNAERLGFVIDALQQDGFFKNARIGLVRYDVPEHAMIANKIFKPRLKKVGAKVVAEALFSKPANSGGAAGLSAQSSNAVLDFKTQNVTHVLFVPTGGAIPLTFIPAAASQGFEPSYGLTSQDAPDFLGRNFPASQLRKARVVGWVPDLDGDEQIPRVAAFARCKKALADAGIAWDEGLQAYCDAFYFLHEALYRQTSVSVASLKAGVESLGTFESPYTLGSSFGAGRYDGATTGRMLRYDEAKPGWKYYGAAFGF